jgi:S1-C subfamily serine protease
MMSGLTGAWYALPRMSEPLPPRHSTRETRLLLLTLAVSVAALLLLARFRFPERPLTDLSTPQPLTRLTRVTAFDELSAMLRDLLRQFEGAVVLAQTPDVSLALLVRDDLALVPLPAGARVEAVAGSPLPANGIVARDEQRGLAVVRVPGYTAPEISLQPLATPLEAPGYVAILEAAPDGPTIRAEFVSRYSTEAHAGWDQPVLVLSGTATAKPGSLLFTLSGRLVGMTLADSGRMLVVPAEALMARATRLANGENIIAVESGIDVQPLTPAIAKATGAAGGVVVSDVSAAAVSSVIAPAGTMTGGTATPSGNGQHIVVGDVITTAADRPVRTPGDWQQVLRAHGAGSTIRLSVVRFGRPLQVSLALPRHNGSSAAGVAASGGTGAPSVPSGAGSAGAAGASARAAGTAGAAARPGDATAGPAARSPLDVMGLALRAVTSGSEVIAIRPASPAARSGLRAGDRITALPGRATSASTSASAPSASPNAIAAAYAELGSGRALLLAIERDGTSHIAAVEKP